MDVYKYLVLYQRAPPDQAENIGIFMGILRFFSYTGILWNVFIFAFLSNWLQVNILEPNFDPSAWLGIRLAIVVIWIVGIQLLMMLFNWIVPNTPINVRIAETRQVFYTPHISI